MPCYVIDAGLGAQLTFRTTAQYSLKKPVMKNQYVGDINDFRKYGLLRVITPPIPITVCWMLTADDPSGNGTLVDYLHRPKRWRDFDPPLFDHLHERVAENDERHIQIVEQDGPLPNARFHSRVLPESADERQAYFQELLTKAQGTALVFFDPDNGMGVKSTPYGRNGSSHYLYWHELENVFLSGYSVLVYQHFPRVDRDRFVDQHAEAFANSLSVNHVFSVRTAHMVFFLAVQDGHRYFSERLSFLAERWQDQFKVHDHNFTK